jgi:hypothetical protein
VTNRQNEASVLWTQATSLMQSCYADKQKSASADEARYWADWLRAGLAAALALSGQTEEARSTFEEIRRGRCTAAEDFPEFFTYYRGGDTQPG